MWPVFIGVFKVILPDYPIEKKKEDKLRRSRLATEVAKMINDFKGKESFVIGIESPWGNGKTSFINMVEESLGQKVEVLYFNPWNFANEESLQMDFFDSYLSLIKDDDEVYKDIKKYSKKINFSFSPEVKFGPFAFSFGSFQKDEGDTAKKLRDKIDKGLKKLNKKILVVVDDIDRLDGRETKLIFRLVKQTANFPNTIFCLAYDRDQVEKRLSSSSDQLDGAEYLKKIVQVSFTLPEPDPEDFWQIFFNDLNKTIDDLYGETEFDRRRWGNMFHGGFKDLFGNIRDIKRFISSLRLDGSILGNTDTNPIDFIGIEAIRVFDPRFYILIGQNKTLFTKSGDYYSNNSDAREKQYKELIDTVPEKIRPAIDGICKELFPPLNFKTTYASESEQTWRTELRVCSQEKFPFYFALGVPSGAVSEVDIKSLLTTLNSKDSFISALMDFYADGKLRKVLSRLVDYIKDIKDDQVKNLILGIWEVQTKVQDERTSMWDFGDVDSSVMRLGYQTIKNKVKSADRKKVLTDLLKETESFYPSIYLVGLLINEFEEKENKPNEEYLLNKVAHDALKKELAKKLDVYSKGDLIHDKKAAFLLFRWKAVAGDKIVNDYLSELVKDKQKVATLVSAFVSDSFSQGFEDYVSTKKTTLDRKSLEALFPEIKKVVSEITAKDLAKLSDKQKEAIKLFRENKKDIFGE